MWVRRETMWVRGIAVIAPLALAAILGTISTGSASPDAHRMLADSRFQPSLLRGGNDEAPNPPKAVDEDVSPPLREIAPAPPPHPGENRAHKELETPRPLATSTTNNPVVQTTRGPTRLAPALGTSFTGVGNGLTGPGGTMHVDAVPPDDNGAVGPNNYVQVVNESFAVFDKTGTVLYGPAPTNTLWSGFGGGCQANDDS
jgi:hypothetical protein